MNINEVINWRKPTKIEQMKINSYLFSYNASGYVFTISRITILGVLFIISLFLNITIAPSPSFKLLEFIVFIIYRKKIENFFAKTFFNKKEDIYFKKIKEVDYEVIDIKVDEELNVEDLDKNLLKFDLNEEESKNLNQTIQEIIQSINFYKNYHESNNKNFLLLKVNTQININITIKGYPIFCYGRYVMIEAPTKEDYEFYS